MARYRRDDFSPAREAARLLPLLSAIEAAEELSPSALTKLAHAHMRTPAEAYSKRQLITAIQALGPAQGWDVPALIAKLRHKPGRSQSGVLPLTVLTKPAPCPGACRFCPSDVRMPKSYMLMEPGAQRAAQHRFDPYAQSKARLNALQGAGHPVDKVELIVLGGSWSSYPEGYQRWFIGRVFAALNEGPGPLAAQAELPPLPGVDADIDRGRYNQRVQALYESRPAEDMSWAELAELQRQNEGAACRAVGLSLETRPELIDAAELQRMRRLGATKVQVGLQSLQDELLAKNGRGHSLEDSRAAIAALRGAGFKIQAHWMANLLGATPEGDATDFARLFSDPSFRPDELKLYPCNLVDSAPLMEDFRAGRWRPYEGEELLALVARCMEATPPYCRLSRVVRDFSGPDIVAGSRRSNLRQDVEARARARGVKLVDIRSRELRAGEAGALSLQTLGYETSIGQERFLEYVNPAGKLAGFLRLSLPAQPAPLAELSGAALIREVHVYGRLAGLGGVENAQHRGLGRGLVEAALKLAGEAGYGRTAVISAVGTRGYYRRLGFTDGPLYQHHDT